MAGCALGVAKICARLLAKICAFGFAKICALLFTDYTSPQTQRTAARQQAPR